jgi:iron complex outermembrane receptor protein
MAIAPAVSARRLFAAALLASAAPAFAQTASVDAPAAALPPAGQGSQQQIVVTGLSRKQSLQTAPVAATVFTQAAVKDARITNVVDLVQIAPSLSFSQSQGAGINLLTVRGITQVQNGQSPVAVIIDGVQQMNSQQFAQDLYNVAQIEVLRGPQGDLWGRNAIGGAIIINTVQPTNDFHVDGVAAIGNGNAYKGQFSVSGPLVKDRIFYDFDLSENHFGGLLENVFLHKTVDRFNDISGRGHIKAILTDDLTVDLRFGMDKLIGGANNFHYQPANYNPAQPCFLDPADPISSFTGDANRVSRTFCANNRGEESRFIREGSIKIAYEQPFATISNVFGWSRVTDYINGDQFPYTASHNVDGLDDSQSQWQRQTSWEDEFRVTSPSGERFHWMVGAYYLNTHDYISRPIGLDEGAGIVKITDVPEFDNPYNPTISYLGNADRNQDYAIFAHLAYDITRKVTAEFGYRYDWNKLNQYVDPASTSGVPIGCVSLYSRACRRTVSFNQGQPKATLSYRPNSDLTLYTSYGIGFRSGQFNQSGTAIAAGLPGVYDVDRAEKANTFEAGFKSQWLDHRLTIDGAFFDTRDKNPSYLVFIGSIGAQVLVNIDKVRLVGGDVDVNYTIVPDLNLFANGGYTHSSIRSYDVDQAVRGNKAPLVPEFNANIGIQYKHPITEAISGFGRFDVQMLGKEYWDADNSTARNAYNLFNLQVGLETPMPAWSLVFFVRNVTDKRYNANYVEGGFSIPAEPRTLGGELRFHF